MSDFQKTRFVYLDHSATTPVDPRVAAVVHETMLQEWGNPSSKYGKGNEAKIVLDRSRAQIASMLGAEPENVFFTSGGTEADNLALFGTMHEARKQNRGDHMIVSAIEHSAVLKTAAALEDEGFRVSTLPVNGEGFIELDLLERMIDEKTVLVSIMHVNNEIGTIQAIDGISEICREKGVLFHTDAVQSFGKLPVDVNEIPIDMVSVSSHKIYGPKGIGALYIRNGVAIEPRAFGGGQERNVRTGTENMPGLAGFGEAVRICSEVIEDENSRLTALRDSFLAMICDDVRGEVIVNGSLENRLGANLNAAFPGVEGESMLLALDLDGIAVSTGSACSSGSTDPSHVLIAIGLDERAAQSSIRFTLGRSTTEDDLHYAAGRVGYHVNRLRKMAV